MKPIQIYGIIMYSLIILLSIYMEIINEQVHAFVVALFSAYIIWAVYLPKKQKVRK